MADFRVFHVVPTQNFEIKHELRGSLRLLMHENKGYGTITRRGVLVAHAGDARSPIIAQVVSSSNGNAGGFDLRAALFTLHSSPFILFPLERSTRLTHIPCDYAGYFVSPAPTENSNDKREDEG